MTSEIWNPMVSTGFSEVIGSWKIIAMRLPRRDRMAASSSCSRSNALEADFAAHGAGQLLGQQAQDRQRSDALAAAGFADDTQRLSRHDRKRHAVDGAGDAILSEEVRPQVTDFEQRIGHGSHAPRKARIETVAQAVTDEVDRQHRDCEGNTGGEDRQRRTAQVEPALGDHVSPARDLGW